MASQHVAAKAAGILRASSMKTVVRCLGAARVARARPVSSCSRANRPSMPPGAMVARRALHTARPKACGAGAAPSGGADEGAGGGGAPHARTGGPGQPQAGHPYPAEDHAVDSRVFGDAERKAMLDEIIRVDHAGELAAVRIYEGQLAVLKNSPAFDTIAHMKVQEDEHLETMDALVAERRVRPTALLPLCNLAGYALGAGTALLGKEAAMACTVAVETVIGEHYNDQIRSLVAKGYPEEELIAILKKNRDEELEHLDTGLDEGAEQAPMYDLLSNVIKAGCRTAIWMAKRV